MRASRPVVGITMGDPAGIGPEVVLKALRLREVLAGASVLVFGSQEVLSERGARFGLPVSFEEVLDPGEPRSGLGGLALVDFGYPAKKRLVLGQAAGECGRASLEYVGEAARWALEGALGAVVTAPVNKQSLALAGIPFAGHTEFLAAKTRARRVAMMLVTDRLRVALVTRHIALKDVPRSLRVSSISGTIEVAASGLAKYFGVKSPRVAVCALNPHASDGGRFGNEEERKIMPAIEQARQQGHNCTGPLPADTAFQRALGGDFDVVIAMYHDQGLIPIKTLGFGQAVNVTLGLPIIRTSVDHGTGFDIVEQGIASCDSLVAAIRLACRMSKQQRAGA